MVELRKELDEVLFATGQEEDICVLGVQQALDRILAPALSAVRQCLGPSVVRIHGLVATLGERPHDGGLSCS